MRATFVAVPFACYRGMSLATLNATGALHPLENRPRSDYNTLFALYSFGALWIGINYTGRCVVYSFADASLTAYLMPIRSVHMSKTVLIADDSPMIRSAVCNLIKAEEHYEVCAEACNGAEAIELAKKNRPDVIILDIAMPVMDGIKAAHELKRIMPEVRCPPSFGPKESVFKVDRCLSKK